MVLVSYSGREINAKLVYYGPGLSGKTTNLEYIYSAIPQTHRGKMVSMKTKTERTLFFDFLPIHLGELSGFKTRFLLYTVPGQVYYNATRKLVLKGVDAVVFVADSKRGKMDENRESLENLRTNLKEHGLVLDELPWVIQYNKRDLPDVYSIDELERALNPTGVPYYEAVATTGQGVFETFKAIARRLLKHLSDEVGVQIVPTKQKPKEDAVASAPAGPSPAPAVDPAATEISDAVRTETIEMAEPEADPVEATAADQENRPTPRASGSFVTGPDSFQTHLEPKRVETPRRVEIPREPSHVAEQPPARSRSATPEMDRPPVAPIRTESAPSSAMHPNPPEIDQERERRMPPAAQPPKASIDARDRSVSPATSTYGPEHQPVAPESPGSDLGGMDQMNGMGDRLRRWFHRSREEEESGDHPEDVDRSDEPISDTPQEEPQDVGDPSQTVPLSVAGLSPEQPQDSAGAREEAGSGRRFREVPILVDLEPSDLKVGVVLKLRIAVRQSTKPTEERTTSEPHERAA